MNMLLNTFYCLFLGSALVCCQQDIIETTTSDNDLYTTTFPNELTTLGFSESILNAPSTDILYRKAKNMHYKRTNTVLSDFETTTLKEDHSSTNFEIENGTTFPTIIKQKTEESENYITENTSITTTDNYDHDDDDLNIASTTLESIEYDAGHLPKSEIIHQSSTLPKKGKIMKNADSDINELKLPGNSNVWTLVGLKGNPVIREEFSNKTTVNSESLENKEAVGTKNLSDWSKIMKEIYGNFNETRSPNSSKDKPEYTSTSEKNYMSTDGTIISGDDLQNVLFKPPITESTKLYSKVAKTLESNDTSTTPSISSFFSTSAEYVPTTENLKNESIIKVNVITSKEYPETTTAFPVKFLTTNSYSSSEIFEQSSTKFESIDDELIKTTKTPKSPSNHPAIELYPKSATTEHGSFLYEVNGMPVDLNFTYSDIHSTITKSDPNSPSNSNSIIAISVSITCVVIISLIIGVIYMMRKRQKQTSSLQRCRPVGLDAYSLDNVSVCHSIRRKGSNIVRQSKRIYGNAAFDDPSLKHNILRAQDVVKFADKKTTIYEEFKNIPQIIARSEEVPHGCEDKNRYANVIPLPETRVILNKKNNDDKTEYINANYVRGPKDVHNYYIATQGPLESTITDFWRMIWENNSRVIIMATDLLENGIEKCAEYLPPSVTLENHIVFEDFQINLVDREVKENFAISTIILKNTSLDESKEIIHYWYKWPEVGVPSDPLSIIELLLGARTSLKHQLSNEVIDYKHHSKIQGPLTIHCSNGTGRTGTLIACDIALRSLDEPTRKVDVPQIAYYVRRGRASSIQTKEQYELIYKVISIYANRITTNNE